MSTSPQICLTELDYISNLPDCVLSHIFSRLPTKDAARTSVLSKDWKYKWTCIYHIDLSYFPRLESVIFINGRKYTTFDSKYTSFRNFVERTLLLTQNLQSFQLSCVGERNLCDEFKTWISTALSKGVRCLEIEYRVAGLVFPPNFCNFYSLTNLTLKSPCTFKVSAEICFPHLVTLELVEVEILNELSMSDPVEFKFLVLETLKLRGCKWSKVKFVEIYAPKLTSFYSETNCVGEVKDYSIKINGDNLAKFESQGDCSLPENIVLSSGSKVVDALLGNVMLISHVHPNEKVVKSGFLVRELLNSFSGLKRLQLSGTMSEAIALAKPTGLSLPKYYQMERLDLYSVSNPEVLLELLHATPFLKILNLEGSAYLYDYDYDAEEFVPLCIVSHLEKVTLSRFSLKMHEMKLAKFFWKNAVNLKSLQLSFKSIAKELMTYPKASTTLTNIFNW